MKTIEEIANQEPIKEELDKQYDTIIQKLQEAKEQQLPIDEGIFGATVGVTVGPKLMRAVCLALGIDPKGTLGNLMTSRLVLTAVGTKL